MNKLPATRDADNTDSYLQWRERFLNIVLRSACLIGLFGLLLYMLTPVDRVLKAMAVVMYGGLLAVTFASWMPRPLKRVVFLALVYIAGVTSLFDYGVAIASIFFLGLIVLCGLLLSARNAVYYALVFSLFNLAAVGWQDTSMLEWGRSLAMSTIVFVLVAVGLHTALEEFQKTQQAARQALTSLENERTTLEERVEERTAGLARKTEHLRATSFIASRIAEIQDLESLLLTAANLVSDQFGYYHTGVFLMNDRGDHVVLQASSSEGGQRMIEAGYALSVGTQGIVGHVAAQKKPRVAVDVGADAIFFNNPHLPLTRSEIALPLMARGKVLGVLDIQSDKPLAFELEDMDVLQNLADQIAIAIENARLMDETQAALMQLEALTSRRTRESWGQELREKGRVFTYTPLGLRSEKLPQPESDLIRVPITLRGQKIGTIAIARRGGEAWSKLDRDMIAEVASQVGLAVDNIRLLEEATQRARQEQTVGRLSARFSQSLDLDSLLQTAAREIGQLPDISEVSVFIGQENEQASQPRLRAKRPMS